MRFTQPHHSPSAAAANDNAGAPVHAPAMIPLADLLSSKGAARALVANGGGAMTMLCDLLCEAYVAAAHDNDNRI